MFPSFLHSSSLPIYFPSRIFPFHLYNFLIFVHSFLSFPIPHHLTNLCLISYLYFFFLSSFFFAFSYSFLFFVSLFHLFFVAPLDISLLVLYSYSPSRFLSFLSPFLSCLLFNSFVFSLPFRFLPQCLIFLSSNFAFLSSFLFQCKFN